MMRYRATSPLLLAMSTLALTACGEEGKRAAVCGQDGAICELATSDDGRFPTDGTDGTDGTAGTDGTDGSDGSDGTTGGIIDGTTSSGSDETGDADSGDTGASTGDETGDTETEPTDPPPGFEAPQTFGDSVLETDLVGIWTLPTDGAPVGYSMAFEVTDAGIFYWREYDDACALSRSAAGWIWVDGSRLVLLFDSWSGNAPWPIMAKFGYDVQAPFLIDAAYAPVIGQIGLSLPPAARVATPWTGRGFTRTVGGGTAQDVWVSETELWAIPPGDDVADILVRDRHTLDTSASAVADTSFRRYWFEGGQIDPELPVTGQVPYQDDGLGNATIDGNRHVYLGNKMATYAPGASFKLDGEILCE